MSISFIIPCYNSENTLRETVRSITKQKLEDYEILLINDGSKDNTLSLCMELSRENDNIVFYNKSNGGVSSARNLGIKKATGDYLLFLDSDDVLDVSFSDYINQSLLSKNDFVYFNFDTEKVDGTIRSYTNSSSKDLIKDYLLGNVYICMCSFLIKKTIVDDNKLLFDENTYFSEDREFIIKIIKCSHSHCYIDKVLFHYKYRDTSAMRTCVYNFNKSTSLDAMERVYKLLHDNKSWQEAALVQLKITIILHTKLFLKSNCMSSDLSNKVGYFCDTYLRQMVPFVIHKYYLYAWIWSCIYCTNKRLYDFLVRA